MAASGDEAWQKRPYSEWSIKDVRQVLEKSPWAHRVKMMVVKPAASKIPCASGNPHCSPDSTPTVPRGYSGRRRTLGTDDIQALQDRRSDSAMPQGLGGVSATAVVRWASARTVREAMVRNGIQRGLVKPEEVEKSGIYAPLDTYVVYVDLRVTVADAKKVPQYGLFTAAMLENSVLVAKTTGERIAPLSVKAAPLPEFDERKELALGAFYVFFPRQVGGKQSLPVTETLVRFECRMAPVAITSEFELQKMAREGLRDL